MGGHWSNGWEGDECAMCVRVHRGRPLGAGTWRPASAAPPAKSTCAGMGSASEHTMPADNVACLLTMNYMNSENSHLYVTADKHNY